MLARQALQNLQLPLWPSAWLGAAQPWVCPASNAFSTQQQKGQDAYAQSFTSPVESLYFARGDMQYPQQLEGNMLGRAFLTVIGAYSRKQQLRNGAAILYRAVTEAAESAQLQEVFGLDPQKFTTQHTLLTLHVWLLINRLSLEGDSKDAKNFRQYLYSDYFFKDVERRVFAHGVTVHVNKWLKKLEQGFYGSCYAYDRALREQGGANHGAFVAALVKNVYDNDEKKRPQALLMARYLTRELLCLNATEIEHIYKGQIRFSTDIKQTRSA